MSVFVVGDVSDPQATQYLVALGVPPDTASDAVARITGGRFDLLHRFVQQRKGGQVSNDEILVRLSGKTEYWMKLDHVATTSPLFQAMLSGPVTSVQAVEIAGPDAVAALVERNIISMDAVSNDVTFSARHVKTLLAEKLAEQQRKLEDRWWYGYVSGVNFSCPVRCWLARVRAVFYPSCCLVANPVHSTRKRGRSRLCCLRRRHRHSGCRHQGIEVKR